MVEKVGGRDPVPALEGTATDLLAERARAHHKYRPLVRRLTPGEFLGLVAAIEEELPRRHRQAERHGHRHDGQ